MLFPKTLEEVQHFKCANCTDDDMNLYTCVACQKPQSGEAFAENDVRAHAKDPYKKKLLCLACAEQGRTLRDGKLYSCRQCAKELGRLKFGKEDLKNLLRGSQKSMRCTMCKFSAALRDKRSDE